MLNISPSSIQFEAGVARIVLTNLTDVQLVMRVRATNTTAYTYDHDEFTLKEHGSFEFTIKATTPRQMEVTDSFKINYCKDAENIGYVK